MGWNSLGGDGACKALALRGTVGSFPTQPTMKKCTICKIEKEFESYNKKKSSKDGLQPHCRACSHERFKKYWLNNKTKQIKVVRARNKIVQDALLKWFCVYLSDKKCVDCSENSILVLEFDHIRGTKQANISTMIRKGYAKQQILTEIAKCEIRCRNCHQAITHKRSNSFKWRYVNASVV